jgi:hypothetical protein
VRCSNACSFPGGGSCSDGGPGSEFASCNFCDDCLDCGPRCAVLICPCTAAMSTASQGTDTRPCMQARAPAMVACLRACARLVYHPPPHTSHTVDPSTAPQLCTNTCSTVGKESWANDGQCDDGRPGAQWHWQWTSCGYSEDCADCGERPFSGYQRSCDATITTSRIAGGGSKLSSPRQYPFLVSLSRGRNHNCSGTPIAPQWVLTAAHWIDVTDMYTHVVVGKHQQKLYSGVATSWQAKIFAMSTSGSSRPSSMQGMTRATATFMILRSSSWSAPTDTLQSKVLMGRAGPTSKC